MRSRIASALAVVAGLVGCSSPGGGAAAPAGGKPVLLVVLSSEDTLTLREGKKHPTGYYFNELIVPVRAALDAGYDVVFADPQGDPPAMDPKSLSAEHFGGDEAVFASYREVHDSLPGLKRPEKLATLVAGGLDRFAGVFFPGGHAPMEDLCRDPDVAAVLRHCHEAGKPTAAICHGPIALASAVKDPAAFLQALERGDGPAASSAAAGWPYAGYRMAIFTTAEEQVAEANQLGGKVRFYPDEALRAAGGKVEPAAPWAPQVVRDRELITGQNPASDAPLAKALVQALDERRAR